MRWKPALTLMVLTTVLPELLTGSTPVTAFLNPVTVVFLSVGYGVYVLLVRELAVRNGIGICGLIFLGTAYGIVNEGLLAKTMITTHNLPVNTYDHYGVLLGISFPWSTGILLWHAFASVIFPICLTQYFFPESSHVPWLKPKLSGGIAIVLMILSSLAFLGKSPTGLTGTPIQLLVLLAALGGLVALGFRYKGLPLHRSDKESRKAILLGVSIIVPFIGLSVLAGAKTPAPLYFVSIAAILWLYARILNHRGWISSPNFLWFGFGWYLQNAVMAILVLAAKSPPLAAATAIADIAVLGILVRLLLVGSARIGIQPPTDYVQ
jgi:hypothetical protein